MKYENERLDFCMKYTGLPYADVGVRMMRIDEFNEDMDNKILIRREDEYRVDEFRRAFEVEAEYKLRNKRT